MTRPTDTRSRHFYTDPLAAAWMAKHFGIVIYVGDLSANNIWSGHDCADYAGLDDDLQSERFLIHPDSLHLLEPRAGDLTRVRGLDGRRVAVWRDTWEVPCEEIIQRDGKPFFWPEVEA